MPRHFAAAACLLLAGCELPRFGAPDPASGQGSDTLHLWQWAVVAALAVAALVWVLVLVAVVRFRRRGHGPGGDAAPDGMPSQRQDNVRLEAIYTIVPVLIVAVLFAATVRTEDRITHLSAEPDVIVDVLGYQWQWQFTYVAEGVVVAGTDPSKPPELVLPVGSTVRFVLHADDVIHSFWVPGFLVKRDLVPGFDNEIDVDIDRAGTFDGRCAEFCGLDHYRMTFTVRAVDQAAYDDWLATQA